MSATVSRGKTNMRTASAAPSGKASPVPPPVAASSAFPASPSASKKSPPRGGDGADDAADAVEPLSPTTPMRAQLSSATFSHVEDAEEMVDSVRLPIFGVIPSRARCDVWYAQAGEPTMQCTHMAPLFLIAAAVQLMNHEELTSPAASHHSPRLHDYYHVLRHERKLSDFVQMYAQM